MRILILQFAPETRGRPLPRFEAQLGTLLTLLKQRDHELSLLGLAQYQQGAIKNALARSLPQLVYADISPVCVDAARRTLQYIAAHEFLPVVAGGAYPTLDRAGSLSLPGVHAIAIGEPDASLVTYLERMKDPATAQTTLGVWLRDAEGLTRPQMPGLVEDLDSLPFPERDLFGYAEIVQRTGQIEITAGRGCPQQCAYCLNDLIEDLYEGRGAWVRRRSPRNICDEIDELRGRYTGVRSVRFGDHAFALDAAWLANFATVYFERCKLPFRCHLRANAVSDAVVAPLVGAGCKWADVEVISGSDFIRNEIFDMELSSEQIRATFGLLRAAGIQSRAIVYWGAPYESEASLEDTRRLLNELQPALVDARPYYPFPGTRAAIETCQENGWLHARGEERYHHDGCGIEMPACRPHIVDAFIRKVRAEFPTEGGEPWWRRWASARSAFVQLVVRK